MIRVALIEDDQRTRDALEIVLNGMPGFKSASMHETAEDALKRLAVNEVDVVLVDLGLPGLNGVECIRRLKARRRELLVMVLTVHEDADRIYDSLKAGATGYVLKSTPPSEILDAISGLVSGGSPMSPSIARKVTQFFNQLPTKKTPLDSLTDREREVLHKLATGYSTKDIAQQLNISVQTVRNHIRNIYVKLEVHSRAEAADKYLAR